MTTWTPVDDDVATSLLGEGIHTGVRKGSGAPEAPALWQAISDSDQAWSDALAYAVWGLSYMGYAVCKKDGAGVTHNEQPHDAEVLWVMS